MKSGSIYAALRPFWLYEYMRNLSELFSCIIIDVSVSKFSSENSASSALLRLNLPQGGMKGRKRKERKKMLLNQHGKSTAPEPLIMRNQMSEQRQKSTRNAKNIWPAYAFTFYPHPPPREIGMSFHPPHSAMRSIMTSIWIWCLLLVLPPLPHNLSLSFSVCLSLGNSEILGFNVYINFCIIFAMLLYTLSLGS